MTEGRINVHLGELKERLQALHPWGQLSPLIRALVGSYLEGRIMHLSPEISKLIDDGQDDEAIALLTNDLVALRQRRVQAGQKASQKRSRGKTQKAKDKAGIKSANRQEADQKVQEMLNMEFSLEGGENDSKEEKKTKGTSGVPGVASRAKARRK